MPAVASIPSKATVYVDANAVVHTLVKSQGPDGPCCAKFFKDVVSRRFLTITTSLTLAEATATAKTLLSEPKGATLSAAESRLQYQRIAAGLRQAGVVIYDVDKMYSSAPVPLTHFGNADASVIDTDALKTTRRTKNGPKLYFKHLGAADGLHISFARSLGAQYVATCDRVFRFVGGGMNVAIIPDVYP